MAYTVHKHHSQQKVSARRVAHVLKSGGCPTPHKAAGGGVGKAEMAPTSAEKSDTFTEGLRASKRIPRTTGGKVGKPMHVMVDLSKHLHVHPSGPQMAAGALNAAGQPPTAPMGVPPPGPAQGLPTGGAGLPMRNQGGPVHAGSASGLSRLMEFQRLREGH
jgi:hypothetical protein